jgi:hypothetical protein
MTIHLNFAVNKVEDTDDADAIAFYTTATSIRSKPKLCNIGKFKMLNL